MPSLTRAEMKTSCCFILRVGSLISLQKQRSPYSPVFSLPLFHSGKTGQECQTDGAATGQSPRVWQIALLQLCFPTPRCHVHLCASKVNIPKRGQSGYRSVQAALKRVEAPKYTHPLCHHRKDYLDWALQPAETPRDASIKRPPRATVS